MVTEKLCARCRIVKPAEAFNKSAKSETGLQSWCRECSRQYSKNRLETAAVNGEFTPRKTAHVISNAGTARREWVLEGIINNWLTAEQAKKILLRTRKRGEY